MPSLRHARLRTYTIVRVEVARVRDVDEEAYVPAIRPDGAYVLDVPFRVNGWASLAIAPGARLSVRSDTSDQGARQSAELRFGTQGADHARRLRLDDYGRHDLLLRVTDGVGRRYIVGQLDAPVRLAYTAGPGRGAIADVTVAGTGRVVVGGTTPIRVAGAPGGGLIDDNTQDIGDNDTPVDVG